MQEGHLTHLRWVRQAKLQVSHRVTKFLTKGTAQAEACAHNKGSLDRQKGKAGSGVSKGRPDLKESGIV